MKEQRWLVVCACVWVLEISSHINQFEILYTRKCSGETCDGRFAIFGICGWYFISMGFQKCSQNGVIAKFFWQQRQVSDFRKWLCRQLVAKHQIEFLSKISGENEQIGWSARWIYPVNEIQLKVTIDFNHQHLFWYNHFCLRRKLANRSTDQIHFSNSSSVTNLTIVR